MDIAAYKLKTYTPGAWTDLVPTTTKLTVIKTMLVSIAATTIISAQITDAAGVMLAVLIPGVTLDPQSYAADMPAITLLIGERLQVKADVSGATFSAFGATA